ncbi:methyltransferase domain-containing protein [Dehalobacter sp. DCM]|uniref:class I SAM-dependent methyltransferase n=1 Tax=Dehalobacter sp. DCM TaxID=2907827 RepID=UPI00308197A8|nr:methyltransferase domain-containing protein [Dehalobacter sp. DCM]
MSGKSSGTVGMNDKGIENTQTLLKSYLQNRIKAGDIVVDATAGRGKDTLFLAECVGPLGKVYAFDIQEDAIASTRELLTEYQLMDRVALFLESHSEIDKIVPTGIKAVIFNLGYLPGSNQQVTTHPETTIQAIEAGVRLLTEKGLIVLTVYRGHDQGAAESASLNTYLAGLPKKDFSVLQGIYLNQGDASPYWLIIQKNRG